MKKTIYKKGESYVCECGRTFEKSQSLNAHFSRCVIHRKGVPPITQRGGGGWSKGMTKDTNEGVAKMAHSLSLKPGKSHSDETKKILSEKRIAYLESNPNVKWYIVNNGERDIKVQGKWEKSVAEWLNEKNIKWERHRIAYDLYRTYTPDFWLPEYNFYVEVKGWLRESDIIKMKKVIEQTDVKIMLLDKVLYYQLQSLTLDKLIAFS